MKIKVTDPIDVGEIVWNWAEIHPDAKKNFCITHEYIPKIQAVYLTMERAYPDETKYGIVRLLPEDILENMVCPSDYINATLEEMYKKLNETENKEMGNNCVKADNDVMLKMAKAAVVAWYNEHNTPSRIGMEDVYIVWFCKTLQNWKALAGTHHSDGMYYEVTYDGDKDCAYVDAYKKWQNVKMEGGKLREGAHY